MSDTNSIPEPVPARPWRRNEDGPEPKVTTYPRSGRPVLEVWSHGAWRRAPVAARQEWADGRVFYQVDVRLSDTAVEIRCLFQWPQDGLRIAAGPTPPTAQGAMPTPPRYRMRFR
ncbi:hypothetical protein [Streptomyces sp. NPDC056190]|uniref:hypothetical protein n=1 Tax=Streptomyces sp. NPDC056190 TaxID=3345741 RepID=UPI0035DA9439